MVFVSRTTTGEYNQPNPLVTIMPDGSVMFQGIKVIKSLTVAAGYFLVGDISKYHIRTDGPVKIEMGYDADDFTKNFVTIRAEQRIAGFIKANDVESFVYNTFAAAKTFLEAAS